METRVDKARITSGHLRESSLAAHGIMEACEVGAKHADREGASDDNLRDAREIHARLDALYNWRSARRIRVEKRLGASVPLVLCEAADAFKRATGCNLSEIQRRALTAFFKQAANGK